MSSRKRGRPKGTTKNAMALRRGELMSEESQRRLYATPQLRKYVTMCAYREMRNRQHRARLAHHDEYDLAYTTFVSEAWIRIFACAEGLEIKEYKQAAKTAIETTARQKFEELRQSEDVYENQGTTQYFEGWAFHNGVEPSHKTPIRGGSDNPPYSEFGDRDHDDWSDGQWDYEDLSYRGPVKENSNGKSTVDFAATYWRRANHWSIDSYGGEGKE